MHPRQTAAQVFGELLGQLTNRRERLMAAAKPLFLQIAAQIEGHIGDGSMHEESQVPSIIGLSAFHRFNPATALKGVNVLAEAGIPYKRRGIGTCVAPGARPRGRV